MNHKLHGVSKLFIDANIIIYFMETQDHIDADKVQEIFAYCLKNKIDICTSEISIGECLLGVYKHRLGIEDEYIEYFSQDSIISLYPVKQEYLYEAAKLGAQNVNLFDALHVITAIENAGEIFLTNDKKIKSDILPILQLSDI